MKEAVVLLNMGGPSSLVEVEMFLRNMFNDPNILNIKSDFLRKMVASFIVNRRVEESKKNYEKIGGSSPIIGHTFSLIEKLRSLDDSRFYTYSMRYTPPFAKSVIEELKSMEIEKITLFSMYPQYSTTTTKSSIDEFKSLLDDAQFYPEISMVDKYYDNREYNIAIIERIKESLKESSASEFDLIFSAHGLPQSVIDRGDPYQKEIEKNVDILKNMLGHEGLDFKSVTVSYQSKVGPMKWIEPSTEKRLKELKGSKVIIYPIAFTIDNSETDYELSIEYRELASKLNIEDYRVSKCLNDSLLFANSIVSLVEKVTN